MKKSILIIKTLACFIAFLLLTSCEKELKLERTPDAFFHIDGIVDSELKSHELSLSSTINGGVTNASAYIINEALNDTTWYQHMDAGKYQIPSFQTLPSTPYKFECLYDDEVYSYSTTTHPEFKIDSINYKASGDTTTFKIHITDSNGEPIYDYDMFSKIYLGSITAANDTIWDEDITSFFMSSTEAKAQSQLEKTNNYYFTSRIEPFSNSTIEFTNSSTRFGGHRFLIPSGTLLKIEAYLIDRSSSNYLFSLLDYQSQFGAGALASPSIPEMFFKTPEALGCIFITTKDEAILKIL